MKKNWKKTMTCLMTASLVMGSLAGCGKSEKGDDSKKVDNPAPTEEANKPEKDNNEGDASSERYIEEGGLTWDTQEKEYVIEDDILNGKKELKLWIDNEKFGDAIVAAFKGKYPDAKVVYEVVSSTDSASKMALEGEAGTGADVFLIPHDKVGEAMNTSVIGMMGRYGEEIEDRFLESAVGTVKIDGQIYGVPVLTECIGLIYNKTMLEDLQKQGLVDSAEPAKDFNDIYALAEKYNDAAKNQWTIRWEAGNSYINYFWLTSNGYRVFGENGDDAAKINLDSQEVIDGLNAFKKFRTVWDVNSGDTTYDSTVVEFAKGQTPYVISGPWALNDIEKVAKENGFEYGVVPLPMVDGKQPYTFSGVQLMCVSTYTKYPAAARALAMICGGDEVEGALYNDLQKLPAVKDSSTIAGLAEDERAQAFMAQAAYSFPMPSITEIKYFWTADETMIRSVWDGTATPEEAAVKAQKDFNDLKQSAQ